MIKMEEPPVGQKISRIRDLAGDEAMKIFGGLGGMFFLEELQRGAVGTMTGFAYPEVLSKSITVLQRAIIKALLPYLIGIAH
jgi:4-hydroxy-tetrahydrodipicolinate synthase